MCRFCELEGRLDEVRSAFQDLQKRDGESDRRADVVLEEIGRLREYGNNFDRRLERLVGEVRVELGKVQEDLVSTKEDLQVFASTLSKDLRSDMEKASKGLADTTGRLQKVSDLVIHALQLDEDASRKRVARGDPVRSRRSLGGQALSYRDVLGKSLPRQLASTPKPMSGPPALDVSPPLAIAPNPTTGRPASSKPKTRISGNRKRTRGEPAARTQRSAVHSEGYQQVRNRFAFVNRPAFVMPTRNIFERFTDLDGETETLVVGDSIVRHQGVEFVHRCKAKRRVFCKPGATVDKIRVALAEIEVSSPETLIICHVGTNDLKRTRSEDLLAKYRQLIRDLKAKTNRVAITSILPRMNDDDELYSKLTYTNRALEVICQSEGVSFINLFDDFRERHDLFLKDGLHLNDIGNARLGRLLHLGAKKYYAHRQGDQRALNGLVLAAENPT